MQGLTMSHQLSREFIKSEVGTTKRGRTRREWVTLCCLVVGNLITASSISLQAPFFPQEAEKKGATPSQYGVVFGIFELTVLIVAPVYGKIVALVTPKFMLDTGMFVMGVSGVLFGVLDWCPGGTVFIVLAYVIRIMEGLGCGAYTTSSFTITAAEFPSHVGTTFGTLQTAFGVGLIIGPSLGGALYEAGGYPLPFLVIASIMILCSFITWRYLPSTENLPTKKTGDVLKFWLHPGVIIDAAVIAVSFTCLGYCQATLEPHIRQFHLSPIIVGLIFIIIGAVYGIFTPIWGYLCDRQINIRLLSLSSCILLGLGLVFLGPASFLSLTPQIWLVVLSLIVFGCGFAGCLICPFSGTLKDTTKRGFPDDLTTYGLVSSLFSVANSFGAFIGPSLGGYLLEIVGFQKGISYLFIMVMVLVVILCCFLGAARFRKRDYAHMDETTSLLESDSMKISITTSRGSYHTETRTM